MFLGRLLHMQEMQASFLHLSYPRGSGYMYATITKYQDYATWEKFWKNPQVTAVRQKANAILTNQMDMFLDEITYAYPELHQ